MKFPATLPPSHQRLLLTILDVLTLDPRIVGVGASGSYATDTMDEFSDLDLTLVIAPDAYTEVMSQRISLLQRIPGLTSYFTGEHVGEPRLIISLFAPDAVHVDFKFVSLLDAHKRVDDIAVLWQQDQCYSDALKSSTPHYPSPDPQWLEDRFWTWVHYATGKIARGEYFEALEFLSFLRTTVLAPLALKQQGLTPSGVRTIEKRLPQWTSDLTETLAAPERQSLFVALRRVITLYEKLIAREKVTSMPGAKNMSLEYLQRYESTTVGFG